MTASREGKAGGIVERGAESASLFAVTLENRMAWRYWIVQDCGFWEREASIWESFWEGGEDEVYYMAVTAAV
jgi:hypothetical protein